MSSLISFYVTVGFIGKIPFMPGTIATLATSLLMWLIIPLLSWQVILFVLLILLGLSIPMISRYQKRCKKLDSKEIVIDECVSISFILLITEHTIFGYILAIVLFRLFDILKVGPVNWIDRHKGKFQVIAVMADDLVAGIYTLIILEIMGYINSPI